MQTPIGQMREPVAILTPTLTADDYGGEVTEYVEGNPIWLSLRSLTTTEAVQFGQVNASTTHVAFGHYGDLVALDAEHRIRHLETLEEWELAGSPIKSPKKDWIRLHLVRRENG